MSVSPKISSAASSSDLPTTIEDLSEALEQRKITSKRITENLLEKIASVNPDRRYFITISKERAIRVANESDDRIAASEKKGKLDGVPIAIKDNFYFKGVPCTAGSKILSNFLPTFSSPAVEKLERAGAVILGTTNLHEFASGVTNVNPYYGTARNPWDRERITGGSSGGSAACVAAGLAFAALGTDTSGSVRIPASLCGVVGIKPTYGLVSTRGTVPLSYSLDHVGILARSCLDAAIVLNAIAEYDDRDPFSVRAPESVDYFEKAVFEKAKSIHRIGVARKFFLDEIDDEVRSAYDRAVSDFESLGFECDDIEIPDILDSPAIWAPIRFSEAAAFHKTWLKEQPKDYGEDVRAKLERGMEYHAVEYIEAKRKALEFRKEALASFEPFDAVITPTTPIPAPKIGDGIVRVGTNELDVYSALVRQTQPFNVTGFPAASVPMGFSKSGLPLGLQIVGKPFEEVKILGIGSKYEQGPGGV